MAMTKKDSEAMMSVGVGLGALILGGLALGTKTGREVSCGIVDALASARRAATNAKLATKRISCERQKDLLDLEMELAEVQAHDFCNWRKIDELEGKIEVLKRHIDHGY